MGKIKIFKLIKSKVKNMFLESKIKACNKSQLEFDWLKVKKDL